MPRALPRRRGPLDRSRYSPLSPSLSYIRAIYPVLYLRVARTKSEVASTWRSSSSKSSRRRAGGRTDGQTDRLGPLSSTPLFYCVVARGAINSRGFTVPWKSAKHPPANIIHGTRPLLHRVTFPRSSGGRNSTAEIESRKSPPIAAVIR